MLSFTEYLAENTSGKYKLRWERDSKKGSGWVHKRNGKFYLKPGDDSSEAVEFPTHKLAMASQQHIQNKEMDVKITLDKVD